MAPAKTMESRTTRSAHPSAGHTPHPPPAAKREDKTGRDSVAHSKFLDVPGHPRMDSTRNTGTPRPTDCGSRRDDSTADSISSKLDKLSVRDSTRSKAPRTDREHREREKSTTSTIKTGSVLGTGSVNTSTSNNATRRDRAGTRLDASKLPSTIYEDDSRAGSTAPQTSRHDTVKPNHLVPYDAPRAPSPAKAHEHGAMARAGTPTRGGACYHHNGESATTRRNDKTFSGAMRDAIAQPGRCCIAGTQIKIQTASGTKIEVNRLEVHKR